MDIIICCNILLGIRIIKKNKIGVRIELTLINLQFIVLPLYDPIFLLLYGYNLMVKMTNFQFVNAGSSPATRN